MKGMFKGLYKADHLFPIPLKNEYWVHNNVYTVTIYLASNNVYTVTIYLASSRIEMSTI